MGFVRDFADATEKAVVKQVVKTKVNKFIDELKEQSNAQKKYADEIDKRVKKSSGLLADIVASTTNVFFTAFKMAQDKIVDTLENNADLVTDLVAKNKEEITEIATAVRTILNRKENKENIKQLGSKFVDAFNDFNTGEIVDIMDKISDEKVNPKVKELAEIWGAKHQYYIINDNGGLDNVNKEEFDIHKKSVLHSGQRFYETESLFSTKQIDEFDWQWSKENGRKTNKYSSEQ